MKILLVEDHPFVANISCEILRDEHGHEVELVRDGQSALAAMARFRPDLVLLDVNLPDTTGFDVAKKIRADPAWDDVILVALSGFARNVDPSTAGSIGIDAYFTKPMNLQLLSRVTRRRPSSGLVDPE